ncbi:MAG: hypothetical protein HZC36_09285 [Armatimonadetes bacterium]|nr:hypothetical protein [Armatimonadota bacterium]
MNTFLRQFVHESGATGPRGVGASQLRGELSKRVPAHVWLEGAVLSSDLAVHDILDGAIVEQSVPHEIKAAFALQYPRVASQHHFVDWVRTLHDPEQLQGAISGVKGKLFEMRFVDYLNDGHLPAGQVASLARVATQPGYDILVHDSHGHLVDLLSAKASKTSHLVNVAIDHYPDIDVVATSEAVSHVAHHNADLVEFGSNAALSHEVGEAVAHAQDHILPDLPYLTAFLLLGFATWELRKGSDPSQVLGRYKSRAIDSGITWGIVELASWATDTHLVGLSIPIRAMVHRFRASKRIDEWMEFVHERRSSMKAIVCQRQLSLPC